MKGRKNFSFLSPAPLPNAHAHEEKYGWLARLGPTMTMNISSTVCEYELYLYVVPLALLTICNFWAWQSIKRDKGLAENDEWRISQNYLLFQAWLGGVGGWLSMKYYHHKTSEKKKKTAKFREKYKYRMKCNLITYLGCLFLVIFLVFWRPLQMFFLLSYYLEQQ